jgi:EAL domain-containing protein (putative c-di-GMP-specific phosphodiesterase class I)
MADQPTADHAMTDYATTGRGHDRPVTLIVDDEDGIRSFVQHVAESVGLLTVAASNGAEALGLLKTNSPAIVVMDLQMPNGDGVQLIQGLAGLGVRAKIVIMSGADSRLLEVTGEIAKQRGLDIAAVLQKPVRFAELRQCLATLYTSITPFSAAVLKQALDDKLQLLHYQPKIRLSDRALIGVEALLRLNDAAGRPVPPDLVLSMAEESGLSQELNDRIFETAIIQRGAWSEAGKELDIAVNLSAGRTVDRDLPDRLAALCREHKVPTESITVEITESSLDADNLTAMETMTRLRLLGFRLSIDDFGTGHSSLVRLRQMPFSELKIDRSFTAIERSPENAVIVRSLVQLAQNLELRSVIEGVEDAYAFRFATELGCDEAQGYFIAKAIPPADINEFELTWRWRRAAFDAAGKEAAAPVKTTEGELVEISAAAG